MAAGAKRTSTRTFRSGTLPAMISWLLSIPWVLMALVIVGGFAVFGLVGMSFVRRTILPRIGQASHQNEVTGFIHHGILIAYGLAVALLAIAVWENHAEVTKVVSTEAVAISAMYRDAGGYPEPIRTRLQAELKAYTEQIINEAWPLQRRGKIPTEGVAFMDRFQTELFAFEPATDGQRALHQEALRAYNELIKARRLRLDSVGSGLPAPMWTVVLLGGLITLASAFFFEVADRRLQKFMIVLLSCTLGLLIFLIAFYDRPYVGSHAITPEAYELIYHQLMQH